MLVFYFHATPLSLPPPPPPHHNSMQHTTKNNRFPDVRQEKPVRRHDRNFVESTRNMKTRDVSQDNMETCCVYICVFLNTYKKSFCHVSLQISLDAYQKTCYFLKCTVYPNLEWNYL